MFGALRFILTAAGLVLIVAAVALVVLAGQLPKMAASGLRARLSDTFGAPCTIESVRMLPLDQAIELRGLAVQNPDAFQSGDAMQFDRIVVYLDPTTLLSDVPDIPRVSIEGGKVLLYHQPGEGLNIAALLETASQSPAPQPSRFGLPSQFRIHELHAEGIEMRIESGALPFLSAPLEVSPFTLTGLDDDTAVSPGETAAIFLRSLLAEALALDNLLKPLADMLQEATEDTAAP